MKLLTLSAFINNEAQKMKDYLTDGMEELDIIKGSHEQMIVWNHLLSKPLTLSMFVPCKDGVPLEKPKYYDIWDKDNNTLSSNKTIQALYEYQAAEKLVIFEGFEESKNGIQNDNWVIQFSTNRIFLDRNVGDSLFVGCVINNPTISDLANSTADNPLILRQ